MKVNVTDDGNGRLKAEVVGDTKEADLKFVNDLTKVKISKIDAANQAELPGAKLEIRDADGEVIDPGSVEVSSLYRRYPESRSEVYSD